MAKSPSKPPPGGPDDTLPVEWDLEPAGVYGLEQVVRCPSCKQLLDRLFVVRLYRARVNFVSSLPRSGRVLACPNCRAVLPGELGAVL